MSVLSHRAPLAGAFSLVLTAAAAAQVVSLSPPAAATDVPKSIVLIPDTTNNQLYAVCSIVKSSRQIRAKVTGAPSLLPGSVAFTRDQFCDAWYSPDLRKLVTAHRFGGIRVWNATLPSLPLNPLSFTTTNYSHEGLKMVKNFVLYSEQHTSPTGVGGLKIYRMHPTTGALTLVGSKLFQAGAGNALAISRDVRHVWQWGDRNNDRKNGVLRVYSTNGFTGNPVLAATVAHAYTTPYSSKDLERNATSTNLLAAMGWDGMRAIKVTNPTSPVINTIIPPTHPNTHPIAIFVDGVTFFPNTNLAVMWGLVRAGSVTVDFISLWNGAAPGFAQLLFIFAVPWRVEDVKASQFLGAHLYLVGRDRQNSMKPILVKI